MDISELFMSRCLELAAHGRGNVAPNPMVGAVLVADDRVIGEGFHREYGKAHAEVVAIESVKDEALLLRSTLYINLEPCTHFGKTAPCAELIILKAIPRVVIACSDPYPEVAGRGIRMLQDAGIEVQTGVLEREAIQLNRFFMTAHQRHRPYIILKWAQSRDGFIDIKRKDASEKPVVFSNAVTRMLTHRLRSEVQAVLVGTNTAVLDDPALTVRYWSGKSPVRVVIDRNRRVTEGSRLFDGEAQTVVFRGEANCKLMPRPSPREVVEMLFNEGIHSVLVEGGAALHRSFFEENLWDELFIETAPFLLEEGVKSAFEFAPKNIHPAEIQDVYERRSKDEMPSIITRYVNYNF